MEEGEVACGGDLLFRGTLTAVKRHPCRRDWGTFLACTFKTVDSIAKQLSKRCNFRQTSLDEAGRPGSRLSWRLFGGRTTSLVWVLERRAPSCVARGLSWFSVLGSRPPILAPDAPADRVLSNLNVQFVPCGTRSAKVSLAACLWHVVLAVILNTMARLVMARCWS